MVCLDCDRRVDPMKIEAAKWAYSGLAKSIRPGPMDD
jgi:hypothetical protein